MKEEKTNIYSKKEKIFTLVFLEFMCEHLQIIENTHYRNIILEKNDLSTYCIWLYRQIL